MRTSLKLFSFIGFVGCLGLGIACKSEPELRFPAGGSGGAQNGEGGHGGQPTAGTVSGTGGCHPSPDEDRDGDGFSIRQGDCDDCNPDVNPNAVEVPTATGGGGGGALGNGIDDDCNGVVDDFLAPCDKDLQIDDVDPLTAAKAVELCKESKGPKSWGVVSAKWTMVDGSPPPTDDVLLGNFHRGHGILDGFGPSMSPQAGSKLLALSSGAARQLTDPDYASPGGFNKQYSSRFPQGFPKACPSCPDLITDPPNDATAVEITIRVPSNVHGFSFNSDYHTYDWPKSFCTEYSDFFVAMLTPFRKGLPDAHILLDDRGNPMSVNSSFIDVCGCANGPPCMVENRAFACSKGIADLIGTGFEGHAATSWLVTTAPVEPNEEITIRWGAFDSGDHILDSTGLVDNWQWITEPGVKVTTTPLRRTP